MINPVYQQFVYRTATQSLLPTQGELTLPYLQNEAVKESNPEAIRSVATFLGTEEHFKEVAGYDGKADSISPQDLDTFSQKGVSNIYYLV